MIGAFGVIMFVNVLYFRVDVTLTGEQITIDQLGPVQQQIHKFAAQNKEIYSQNKQMQTAPGSNVPVATTPALTLDTVPSQPPAQALPPPINNQNEENVTTYLRESFITYLEVGSLTGDGAMKACQTNGRRLCSQNDLMLARLRGEYSSCNKGWIKNPL